MQDLINSFVRLSAAMTVFGMQQMQTAVGSVDPNESMKKMKEMLDSLTHVVNSHIEESRKATVESMSSLGTKVVDRTWEAVQATTIGPNEAFHAGTEALRYTLDSANNFLKSTERHPAEPRKAHEALHHHRS